MQVFAHIFCIYGVHSVIIKEPKTMRIAHIPFGVTRPLLDGFLRTPSQKYASERV